jgi:hypothetical protein
MSAKEQISQSASPFVAPSRTYAMSAKEQISQSASPFVALLRTYVMSAIKSKSSSRLVMSSIISCVYSTPSHATPHTNEFRRASSVGSNGARSRDQRWRRRDQRWRASYSPRPRLSPRAPRHRRAVCAEAHNARHQLFFFVFFFLPGLNPTENVMIHYDY